MPKGIYNRRKSKQSKRYQAHKTRLNIHKRIKTESKVLPPPPTPIEITIHNLKEKYDRVGEVIAEQTREWEELERVIKYLEGEK